MKTRNCFDVPLITDRRQFWLRSWTWGLPVNLFGAVVACGMLLTGHRPLRWGPCVYFEHGHDWGGMDWGCFFVVEKDAPAALKDHEMGHAFQNAHFGPMMPLLVTIPSSLRYWIRRFREKCLKQKLHTAYDDIWFEAQASHLGREYHMLRQSHIIRVKRSLQKTGKHLKKLPAQATGLYEKTIKDARNMVCNIRRKVDRR